MKVIVEGHAYELANFENPETSSQGLQFIHKELKLKDISELEEHQILSPGPDNFELVTVENGTTNEEVLAVLIDRMYFLNGKFPCKENSVAITHLETALLWLEKRTNDRKKRQVEGNNKV